MSLVNITLVGKGGTSDLKCGQHRGVGGCGGAKILGVVRYGYYLIGITEIRVVRRSLLCFRFERIEIPLHIVPSGSIGQACLESLVELPRIITQEEDEAYLSLAQNSDMDLITKLHNASGKKSLYLSLPFLSVWLSPPAFL